MLKGGRKAAAKKPRAPKGNKAYQLAEEFPAGEVLKDNFKKEWKLGNVIGQGGFGLIYLASQNSSDPVGPTADYVVKIEPQSNGPLFCEMHFYQRVAQPSKVDEFKKSRKMKYLGVPKFIGSGQHVKNGKQFRFLVMERFGTDIQKIFENSGRRFERHTVCAIAIRMIDALEFIHRNDYVHADIKAANILLGYKAGQLQPNEVHLVDYGLATKYLISGNHINYKEDPRRAHDGTVDFASVDAHKGVAPARRGDLEILGYCCLEWLCGKLPWHNILTNKDGVANLKLKYKTNVKQLIKDCFTDGGVPDEIQKYFQMVNDMDYDEEPEYNTLREIFRNGLKKCSWKDEWKLGLPLSGGPSSSPKKTVKRKGTAEPAEKQTKMPRAALKASPEPSAESKPSKLKPAPPRKTATPKAATPRRSPGRLVKSPLKATKSVKSPLARGKKSSEINGGNTTPVSKGTTRRFIKRRKVQTTDAGMQTSPPVS